MDGCFCSLRRGSMPINQLPSIRPGWLIALFIAWIPTTVEAGCIFHRSCSNAECNPAGSDYFGYYPTCWRLWPPGGPICLDPQLGNALPCPLIPGQPPPPGMEVIPTSATAPGIRGDKPSTGLRPARSGEPRPLPRSARSQAGPAADATVAPPQRPANSPYSARPQVVPATDAAYIPAPLEGNGP
jgi:hypothetical protein